MPWGTPIFGAFTGLGPDDIYQNLIKAKIKVKNTTKERYLRTVVVEFIFLLGLPIHPQETL